MVSQAGSVALFVPLAAVAAVAVLAVVLRPVWREARSAALFLGAGSLVLAGLLYVVVGTPAALQAPPPAAASPVTMEDAIAQLEAELDRSPQQAEGWRLLGRAYRAQGRLADAAAAAGRAAALLPDDPDALVEAAEARALARDDRHLDAQAIEWLDHALAVAPGHQRARWFRGIAHRQAGDPAAAAETWAPLLALVDATTAASLREQVDLARAEAGLPPLPEPAPTSPAAAIRVEVDVAPALAGRIPEGATLYVLARPVGGPPMPVAAERLPAASLPVTVTLDDSDSLMPTLRLSQAGAVEVVARLSASGDATAMPGDLESGPLRTGPGTSGAAVALTIDRVVE